jgi:4-amino-4-deoxychorismate lyase
MKLEFLETIRVQEGEIYHLPYHQQRYEAVLLLYGAKEFKELREHIEVPKKGLHRCRVLYNIDEIVEVSYYPYTKRNVKHLKVLEANSLEYSCKYANREALEQLFSKKGSADDILIVKNGLITDTTIANIAFFDGEEWLTPKKPLLRGTTRERLLQENFLKTADITISDIKEFEKMALMNAMIDFDIIADKKPEDIIC